MRFSFEKQEIPKKQLWVFDEMIHSGDYVEISEREALPIFLHKNADVFCCERACGNNRYAVSASYFANIGV